MILYYQAKILLRYYLQFFKDIKIFSENEYSSEDLTDPTSLIISDVQYSKEL